MLFVLHVVLIFISPLFADDFSRCPASVQPNQYFRTFGERCYEFAIYREVYWEEASKECSRKGGSLATVNDLATQKFFENSLSSLKSTRHGIWIGFNDRASEDHYTWVSGEETPFTYWASGEPSSVLHSVEDCVIMRNSKAYHWEDQPCNLWPRHYSYICQYDMLPTTTMTTTTTTTTTSTPTTTPTTTATTTTPTTTTTTTTTTSPTTTSTTTTTTTPCQLLSCTLDCSLNGFKTGPDGCPMCTCD
ncbi:echinoidin-like [Haliotis cracherodii]|uniref:echinoidin-like n=1 Tax=Haliotis cracherodii TaxID=6455 RepID=UPI0039E73DA3